MRTYKEVGAVMGSDGSDFCSKYQSISANHLVHTAWRIVERYWDSIEMEGDAMRNTGLIVRDRSMDCIRPT